MKKDQHKKSNHQLAAQETDGEYVEFSKELADPNDVKAMARMKAADQRAKKTISKKKQTLSKGLFLFDFS